MRHNYFMFKCRCGFDPAVDTIHMCHSGYLFVDPDKRCKNPGTQRFYNTGPASLAGMQMKFQVADTIACDECWAKFKGAK